MRSPGGQVVGTVGERTWREGREGGLHLGTCRLWEDREQKRPASQKFKHLWDFSWMCHGRLKLNLGKRNPPSCPKPTLPLVGRDSSLSHAAPHLLTGLYTGTTARACPQSFSSDGLGSGQGTGIIVSHFPADCNVQPSWGITAPQQSNFLLTVNLPYHSFPSDFHFFLFGLTITS